MEKKKETNVDIFQGSHMVPTDEAVWDFFVPCQYEPCSLEMFIVICSQKPCARNSCALPRPVVSVHIISFQKIDS